MPSARVADSVQALKSYEERIQTYTLQLLHAITERKGSPMNMTDWFSFYSFDVMADLAFGKSFNMLLTGEAHFVLNILRKGQAMSGVFSAMPWFFNLLSRIPGAGKEFKKMNEWCYDQVEKRKNVRTTFDLHANVCRCVQAKRLLLIDGGRRPRCHVTPAGTCFQQWRYGV
jgi:cytochrome P450